MMMKQIFILLTVVFSAVLSALPGDMVLESGPYKVHFAQNIFTPAVNIFSRALKSVIAADFTEPFLRLRPINLSAQDTLRAEKKRLFLSDLSAMAEK